MKENFFDIIAGDGLVLVDFYTEGCAPCKTQAEILKRLAAQTVGKCRILKVDAARNMELASTYVVMAVPTLLLFKKGEVKWRAKGLQSENGLAEVISKFTT